MYPPVAPGAPAQPTKPTHTLPKYVTASFPAFREGKEAVTDLRSAEAAMQ